MYRRNQPFAPADRRTAQELMREKEYTNPEAGNEPGMGSLRATLVTGWKMVDTVTRKP